MDLPETPVEKKRSDERRPPPLKFVARVAPVKEVTLHGTADVSYWRAKLAAEGLTPVEVDGRAQLFISGTESRFWGIRFREALIGIQVVREVAGGEPVAGVFLVQAWNSLRAFAWIERTMFGTPYDHGQVTVEPRSPAQLQVTAGGKTLITATQVATQDTAQQPDSGTDESWQGPVFLPTRPGKPPQLFFAELSGRTEHYAFMPSRDSFNCSALVAQPALQSLRDSRFTPTRWHLRAAAEHAKSKTYRVADWYGQRSLIRA